MKILKIVAAFALIAIAAPALAQSGNGLQFVPLSYCRLTVDTAATFSSCPATALNSAGGIPKGATRAYITTETQAVRYRDDGTAPTATIGMPLAVAQTLVYSGTLSKIQFISQTAGAVVNVLFYR